MKMNVKKYALLALCPILGLWVQFLSAREIVSLDGEWEIAEGSFSEMPKSFPSKIKVPGFADMAKPAFKEVGAYVPEKERRNLRKVADPLREAFWYRRTIKIENEIPAVAQIKILRAAYTSELFVNGDRVGAHWGSFTPFVFDVKPFLKEGENEIVIKVGASLAQIPPQYATGFDFEKSRYLPGIYDSVSLILSGGDFIDEVQIAPNIDKGGIRVVGHISNFKAESRDKEGVKVPLKLSVRERKSGKVVASSEIESPALRWYNTEKFDTFIKIPNFKTWSPESPFLYELDIESPTDKYTSRFGMRTFKYDTKSEIYALNGKPYYLRGTNVCFFRFSEDPLRGELAWDKKWVRNLYKSFKGAHWNSLRHCIGFPPEFWYEIADEEGFLIQDEFPIWTGGKSADLDISGEITSLEYMQWIREHINYPSVAIWDAQNESKNLFAVEEAIKKVRDYDLSERPWDIGWGIQLREGDSTEIHPYRANWVGRKPKDKKKKEFSFPQDLKLEEGKTPKSGSSPTHFKPIIINEYDWLWINRDGSLPTLTRHVYETLCGKDASVDEIRQTAARYIALLTEFWRSGRHCAAVMHFVSLTYGRPDGQTCDNFIDMPNQVYEPYFKEYVFDAFTPMGLFMRYYEDTLKGGSIEKISVDCINDEYENFEGRIVMEIKDAAGKILFTQTKDFSVGPLGKSSVDFEVRVPKKGGKYDITATAFKKGSKEKYTRSARLLKVE